MLILSAKYYLYLVTNLHDITENMGIFTFHLINEHHRLREVK
jgi:hypothetical protein